MLLESVVLSLCTATYVLAFPMTNARTNDSLEQVATVTYDSLKHEVYKVPIKQRLGEVKMKRRNSVQSLCGENKSFNELIIEYGMIKKEAQSKYDEIIKSYLSEIKELEKHNSEAYIIAAKDLIVQELQDFEKTLKLEKDEVINKMKESLKREFAAVSSA